MAPHTQVTIQRAHLAWAPGNLSQLVFTHSSVLPNPLVICFWTTLVHFALCIYSPLLFQPLKLLIQVILILGAYTSPSFRNPSPTPYIVLLHNIFLSMQPEIVTVYFCLYGNCEYFFLQKQSWSPHIPWWGTMFIQYLRHFWELIFKT
jgi:hypothetical protein